MSNPIDISEELDDHCHWVTQQCEQGLFGNNFDPLINGIIKFAVVWDVIWLYVFATNWETLTMPFVGAWLLMLFWGIGMLVVVWGRSPCSECKG